MVRLISSRLHRCYSRRGVQRSTQIENLSTIIHLFTWFGLMLALDLSTSLSNHFSFSIPPFFLTLITFQLLTIQIFDFYAAYIAHRKFYRWSKIYKRPAGFLSTPTKVDALITSFHIFGAFILFASSCGILGPPWSDGVIPTQVNFFFCLVSFIAIVLNLVLSLPSLDFGVPVMLARVQNLVVALFCVATVFKLQILGFQLFVDFPRSAKDFLLKCLLGADTLILTASLLNVVRVAKFLSRTRYWAMEEVKTDRSGDKKGLLSWFKGYRTTADGSDIESDDLDDYDFDMDDDEWQNPSSRHAAL